MWGSLVICCIHSLNLHVFLVITVLSDHCARQVNNRCPMSLQIDWWEIPPYIYKDKGAVSGIFPEILKRLVHECCDKDPALNNQDNAKYCVNISYSKMASNDSEKVKKNIGNGTYCAFCCTIHFPQSGHYCITIYTVHDCTSVHCNARLCNVP